MRVTVTQEPATSEALEIEPLNTVVAPVDAVAYVVAETVEFVVVFMRMFTGVEAAGEDTEFTKKPTAVMVPNPPTSVFV